MTVQTQIFYRGDGSSTLFSFPFPYIDETHVKVRLYDEGTDLYTDVPQDSPTYPWRLATASEVEFTGAAPPAPSTGAYPDNILIERETDADAAYATFFLAAPSRLLT